jgi:hypothetical protein
MIGKPVALVGFAAFSATNNPIFGCREPFAQ